MLVLSRHFRSERFALENPFLHFRIMFKFAMRKCGGKRAEDGGASLLSRPKKEINAKDSPKVTEARELSKLGS